MKWRLVSLLVAISLGVSLGWWQNQLRLKKERLKPWVYVVAHPDDDLLFMNPSIMHNLDANEPVVVVYLTAGDAGQDESYWQNRFKGIEKAYEFLGGIKHWQKGVLRVGSKELEVRVGDEGRLKLVLVKLPDGGYEGEGFEKTGYQSLAKLWFGEIETIKTLDGQVYSRQELVEMLVSLLESLKPRMVSTQDFVGSYGEGDHSDHLSVARLVKEAVEQLDDVVVVRSYVDYGINRFQVNINGDEWQRKNKALEIYLNYDESARSDEADWKEWSRREYMVFEGYLMQRRGIGGGLRVRGNKLVDEKGEVRLRGVATKVFRWRRNEGNIKEFWRRWEVMRNYGVNLVMAYIYPDTFVEFAPAIDKLVKRAETENFEVALIPVEDDIDFGDVEGRVNSAMRFPEFVGGVAERYKNNKNVIYGIWAEPANMSEVEYVNYIKLGVREIRKRVKNAVVIVDGLNYGRKIGGLVEFKKMGNIVLDFHDYPAADERGLSRFLQDWRGKFIWEQYVGKGLPVMVGEFGGVWKDGFGSKLDLWWIEEELKKIDQKKVNYVMYTMDNEGGLSLFKPGGIELSEKGKLFREFLMKENRK